MAMHQTPAHAGPAPVPDGEAGRQGEGDEARRVGLETGPSGVTGHAGTGLLEAALSRLNMIQAWERVRSNQGSAGSDGRTIEQTQAWLQQHWPEVREQLLQGRYRPAAVRGVQIPKADGTKRQLGIPTVLDRLIQQALLQVLQPQIDPSFSAHSYGFRPGRSAQQAVRQAQQYVQAGRGYVVDVDLEKFFDRVDHDVLMSRLERRIEDRRVLQLIRRYLQAGMLTDGIVVERHEGTPQGGPLSPLLANILLDEVDRALERRGHAFVRYADDCNVYVRSQRAGERVLAGLRKLYAGLKLKINEAKSAVARATERAFLGFGLYQRPGGSVKRCVAPKALAAYRARIRKLTRRSAGRSVEQIVAQLRRYQQGWFAYFRSGEYRRQFSDLDGWLRRRLRAIHLKHWKNGWAACAALEALGATVLQARTIAGQLRRWWHTSHHGDLHRVMDIAYFDRLGVVRFT